MTYPRMPKRPAQNRRQRFWWSLAIAAILLLLILPSIAHFFTEWYWFKELGRTDAYWTLTWGPWLLGGMIGLLFFLFVFGNIVIAMRLIPETSWRDFRDRLADQAIDLLVRSLRRLTIGVGALVSLLMAMSVGHTAATHWQTVLLFFHAQSTGVTDPVFQRDISFYFFRLPVWELLARWGFFTLVCTLVLVVAIYLLTRVLHSIRRSRNNFFAGMLWHLSILLSLALLCKAILYMLGRYGLLTQVRGDFVGPFYTEMHASMPGLMIMAVLAIIAAALVLTGAAFRSLRLSIGALLGLMIASLLLLAVYPSVIERFRVEPNQLAVETLYLQRHLNLTRQAYGIDKIARKSFTITPELTQEALTSSPNTVKNIRLWDYRPLLQVYSQYQELQTYYDIANVDIDRYLINGQPRQVMLAARELNVNNIPGRQSWTNQHLVYTHGYGLVMSPVNEVDQNKGQPRFFINNIPPKSTVPSLQVTQPAIYYGELDNGYVIVRTAQPEFDYPGNDQQAHYTTRYEGTAGIPLASAFTRFMAAVRFRDINLLISNRITSDSRLLYRRQIIARVRAVAPFLDYDADPYLIVGTDGNLYWMLDAYTSSARFPYSRYSSVLTASETRTVNYLRNPVKVVVDAYNGSVNFYLNDDSEPVIRAWQAIFPGMFQPITTMPAGLHQHIRVPEGLFNVISDVFRRYHLANNQADLFFQQADLWDIPAETTSVSNGATTMEAYYIMMSLPGASDPEYLLIRPYTPHGKRNMIAWLSARSDPEHYGDLLTYEFPKESQFSGPEQVQANINTEPEISSAISLWNSAGSRVIWGNLLVIPIANTVLYVRPLYLQSENSPIPELQRVVVADQRRVAMRETLNEALAALTGARPLQTAVSQQPGTQSLPDAPADKALLARSALEHYKRGQEALQRGDWATYGNEMDAVRRDLEAMNQ